LHPQSLVNAESWDSIYWCGNPTRLTEIRKKNEKEVESCILDLVKFLKRLSLLQKIGITKITPPLESAKKSFHPDKNVLTRSYKMVTDWPTRFFNYSPRYLRSHYLKFFECEQFVQDWMSLRQNGLISGGDYEK